MSFISQEQVSLNSGPLVSFVLLSYNQEKFIAEAILGAFAQNYSPLQIILSDDCSSDKTFSIMEEMFRSYDGPHKVLLNRNEHNIGIGSHINKVMDLAEGEWIVGAAGDDISLPERTAEIIRAAIQANGKAMSIWSRAQHMSLGGNLLDIFVGSNGGAYSAKEIINNKRVVVGCSHAWHRDTFKIFGPLHQKIMFEDNAISFRSYLLGEILFIDKSLVYYRQHESNLTNYTSELSDDVLIKRMAIRRRYSVIGVYQRLLDFSTYRDFSLVSLKELNSIERLLLLQLLIAILKLKIADFFPIIDKFYKFFLK